MIKTNQYYCHLHNLKENIILAGNNGINHLITEINKNYYKERITISITKTNTIISTSDNKQHVGWVGLYQFYPIQ